MAIKVARGPASLLRWCQKHRGGNGGHVDDARVISVNWRAGGGEGGGGGHATACRQGPAVVLSMNYSRGHVVFLPGAYFSYR